MKVLFKLFGAAVLALFALMITEFEPVNMNERISFYQLYNSVTNEHLYTTDPYQAVSLAKVNSWTSEGKSWVSPVEGDPVYRLYNQARHDYIMTKNADERDRLIAAGWKINSRNAPSFYSGGKIPVYRLSDPKTKIHYFTSSLDKYNALPEENWIQEGVAFYVLEQGSPLEGPYNISNTPSAYAIEADVRLTGKGSGYHAKLVAQTPTSAISFGLQYDTAGMDSYKDRTGFIIENIYSNNKGEQSYFRPGLAKSGQIYRMLLTVEDNGACKFYVNGIPLQEAVSNPRLAHTGMDLSVEGSGKHNRDSVDARFENIKIKKGYYDSTRWFRADNRDTNETINSDTSAFYSDHKVIISGIVSGIREDQDWDSAYNKVSGIVTFYE